MTTIEQMGLNPKSVGYQRYFAPAEYSKILKYVLENGEDVSPGGKLTKEMIDMSLIVRHPSDRIIPDRGRKMNIAFAIAEWLSYVIGIDDVNYFKQFISTYDRFSSDGVTLDGAYGTRIVFDSPIYQNGDSIMTESKLQWEGVVSELKRDPMSRRAIISIFNRDDLYGGGGKNTPCTLNLQFFIRKERLHCKANMRSCDIVKGLTYDMFSFTLIQELIARQLEIEMGFYIHNAGSFHLYVDDFDLVNKLENPNWRVRMKPMPKLNFEHLSTMKDMLDCISFTDHFLKELESFPNEDEFNYMRNLLLVMKSYLSRSNEKRISEACFRAVDDVALRYVLRPWLVSAGVLK